MPDPKTRRIEQYRFTLGRHWTLVIAPNVPLILWRIAKHWNELHLPSIRPWPARVYDVSRDGFVTQIYLGPWLFFTKDDFTFAERDTP